MRLRTRWEIPAFAGALALSTWWLFSAPLEDSTSLLRTPTVPLALLLAASFRLPPRWSSLMALGTVLLAAGLAATGHNPFTGPDPHAKILDLQAYLALMVAVTLIVAILVAAMKLALEHISTSEARYRNFIAVSSEAVWRVEIEPPMPTGLPQAQRVQWLREHARVAESNGVFDGLSADCTEPHGDHAPRWNSARSWCALFEAHLDDAEKKSYVLEALRLNAAVSGRQRSFMVAYRGVLANGQLQRIWCVAHDISEILELNNRLSRERERLKAYAHQVLNAEERARRTTAKDLHDGIGQTLTGMAMSLEVARMQAPQVAPLLDDIRSNLRQVQDRTRNMIADLSPPGLYELGLAPALQWLAVHFRSQEKLRVQLDCSVEEDAIGMELRVLVFKLVRELLRNVVKHSGVDSARVQVRGDSARLSVEVEDTGRGFEWQLEMFGPQPGAFGLWSIGDRVGDMGGQFSVDSAPGHGSRFKLEFPLTR
jgi:signal transduction histidine kinase